MSFQTQLEAINAARPASDAMTFDAFMALPLVERIDLRDTFIFGHAPAAPVEPMGDEIEDWEYEPLPYDVGPHW